MDFGHLGVPGQVVVELKLDKNFANEYVLSHKMEENLALEQKTLKQDIVDLKVVCIFFSKITIFLDVFLRIILLEFQIWHHLLNYFTSSDFNIFLKTQLFSNKYWCTRKRLYYSKNQKMKHKKSDCKN